MGPYPAPIGGGIAVGELAFRARSLDRKLALLGPHPWHNLGDIVSCSSIGL